MTNLSIIVSDSTIKSFRDIAIKDGQLIFMQDTRQIALDSNGSRSFYNQIEILNTDAERQSLQTPVNGVFYFVLGTTVLWHYQNGWTAVTQSPENYIYYVEDALPEIGSENTLYVDKENKEISVWDSEDQRYEIVSDAKEPITNEQILNLFR